MEANINMITKQSVYEISHATSQYRHNNGLKRDINTAASAAAVSARNQAELISAERKRTAIVWLIDRTRPLPTGFSFPAPNRAARLSIIWNKTFGKRYLIESIF